MNAFQTEVAKPEYAGMTDQQVAEALNATVVSGRRLVPLAEIVFRVFAAGAWGRLAAASAQSAAAAVVKDYLTNPHVESIDLDLPATRAALAALLEAQVWDQALIDAIDGLANVTSLRREAIRYRVPVRECDVALARKQIAEATNRAGINAKYTAPRAG